jgi:hypothetical protein
VVGKTLVGAHQTITTGIVTSAIGAVNYSSEGGLSFSSDSFTAGVTSSFKGALTGAVGTFTGGLIDLKADGFVGSVFKDTKNFSNTIGGLAGQAVGFAMGEDFKFNLLNLSSLTGGKASGGLLELSIGRKGVSAAIGSGGLDMSLGTIASAINGISTMAKVNSEMKKSGQEEAAKYAVALRSLYSGGKVEKAEYEAILAGKTNITEDKNLDAVARSDYDEETGTKTITLGAKSMDSGGRYDTSVVLAHEAYRNGKNDGIDGQLNETNTAVKGHINMSLALMSAYGAGSINGSYSTEANNYLNAVMTNNYAAFNEIFDNYDSSADYWKLVKREDGTFGVIKDGNHSLLDENGNILVRSPLDIIDENGKIVGHRTETDNSYTHSFGMLMGMYTDFNQNGSTLEEFEKYDKYVDSVPDGHVRAGIKEAMAHTAADGSIDVNAYLMTYKDVANGKGVYTRYLPSADSVQTSITIKNERDEAVGTISSIFSNERRGEVDHTMIENMIPEGRRLNAATFQIDAVGNVTMFGLGSTMPDPNAMGKENKAENKYPAIADGLYRSVVSLHGLDGNSQKAFRLFDYETGKNYIYEDVTGPKRKDAITVPEFNYTKIDNWGKGQSNLPGYYYDDSGQTIDAKVFAINGHKSNNNPYATYDIKNKAGEVIDKSTGGSKGCQTWLPGTYNQIIDKQNFGTFGNYTINRSLFGDGTGGKNNWKTW